MVKVFGLPLGDSVSLGESVSVLALSGKQENCLLVGSFCGVCIVLSQSRNMFIKSDGNKSASMSLNTSLSFFVMDW